MAMAKSETIGLKYIEASSEDLLKIDGKEVEELCCTLEEYDVELTDGVSYHFYKPDWNAMLAARLIRALLYEISCLKTTIDDLTEVDRH